MWCPSKMVLHPVSPPSPAGASWFPSAPRPLPLFTVSVALAFGTQGSLLSPLCCYKDLMVGVLWGCLQLVHQFLQSPIVRGQARHFLGVPWKMLAEEMHTNIEWKGLEYFIKMVVWNFVSAWPSMAHIKRWKYDIDIRASCKQSPSGVLKTKWSADQQRSLPFGCWVGPGIHCIINSVTRGQLCSGPEDTDRKQVWAASSRRYWW